MEAVTAELEAMDFGLAALSSDSVAGLSTLLREVRLAANDFVEDPA